MQFTPTRLGSLETAGTDPLYRLRRLELALRDVTVWELDQDLFTLAGLLRRAAAGDPAARRGPRGPRPRRRRGRPGRRRRHRAGRAGPAAPRPRQARARQRAPGVRGRARPHRLGVAVADAGDGAQGRPDLRERLRPHRARAAVRLRRARRRSSTRGSRSTTPSSSSGSAGTWRPGASCRWAGCGSSPTPTSPAARLSLGSSCWARASSAASSGWTPRRSGCPTRSATPARCRRSWRRRGRSGS